MRRALVFGKFMPLHKGHELVINRALQENDHVTCVVYNGIWDRRMPAGLRMDWIEHLFPELHSIVNIRDHITDGTSDDPIHAQSYADQLSFLGKFDRVYTSEPQYQDFADALGAEHHIVDAARSIHSCSGREIRANLFDNRHFLDPYVYSSLIQKIVFVGTESTGKSTLARAMANLYDTQWAHEYGRELWSEQNWTGVFSDMLKIGNEQTRREYNKSLISREYLFCDTNAWTTLQWSLMCYGTYDPRLFDLAWESREDYTWILCDNDFGFVQDGTRELEGEKSYKFQQQHIDNLEDWKIPYFTVSGPLEQRIEQVNQILNGKVKPSWTPICYF